ncbi:Tetratricopeptide repeat protein 4 homolog [Linum grandiflorum]
MVQQMATPSKDEVQILNTNPQKTDKYLRWPKEMDKLLLDLLKEEKTKGNKDEKQFNKAAWKTVIVGLNSGFQKYGKTIDKTKAVNRLKTIQNQMGLAIEVLDKKSGFGWNDITKKIEAAPSVWDTIIKVDSEMGIDDIDRMVANEDIHLDPLMPEFNESPRVTVPPVNIEGNARPGKVSTKGMKRKRSMSSTIAEEIMQVTSSMKEIAKAIQNSNQRIYGATELSVELKKLGLEKREVMEALDFLKDNEHLVERRRWSDGLEASVTFRPLSTPRKMALLMEKGTEPTTESEIFDLDAISALKQSSAIELKVVFVSPCFSFAVSQLLLFFISTCLARTEEGNKYVKMGKKHFSDAIDCYTRAINQNALTDLETSLLYSNRAHVNLLLGNYRRALTDAEEAIKLSPSNVKAFYRAAKASLSLNLLSEAKSFGEKGLELDSSNAELDKLVRQIGDLRVQQDKREAEVNNAVAEAKELVSAFETRGLKMGVAMYQELAGLRKPQLDQNKLLHWPVLLLYAEVMSSDFIEDFCEIDMFSTHFDMISFPEIPLAL